MSSVPHAPRNTLKRLLLLTQDTRILEEGTAPYIRVQHLQEFFSEIHIILLNRKARGLTVTATRFGKKVWVHPTNSASAWRLSRDAGACAEREIVFGGKLCADVIVAEDMQHAGLAGHLLAQKHGVPLQLHVYEEKTLPLTPTYPILRAWVTRYLLNVVLSIRTETESMRNTLIGMCERQNISIEVLPACCARGEWERNVLTNSLKERYPQFKFIMLHMSSMCTGSHSREVILGASNVLRQHPSVGLIITGSGPCRSQLESQAIALCVQHQIEFVPAPGDMLLLLRSADILLHFSEDPAEDDIVRMAGIAQVPMVLAKQGIGGRLFTNADSAYLCDTTDTPCIANGIRGYLEGDQTRTILAQNAYAILSEKLDGDYAEYLDTYVKTIVELM